MWDCKEVKDTGKGRRTSAQISDLLPLDARIVKLVHLIVVLQETLKCRRIDMDSNIIQ